MEKIININYENYQKTSKKKNIKKIILNTILILFILFNINMFYSTYQKIYHKGYTYPQAKKWEYMAMIVRNYGGYVARIPTLDERDWIIKQFINLDNYLLDKAYQYIPDDDLERHLKIWNLVSTYQAYNVPSGVFYGQGVYTIHEVRDILDNIWEQLEYVMTLKTRDQFYEIEKFKVWQGLSYIYVKSTMAYWMIDEKTINQKSIQNATIKMERFQKMYDYNEYISKYYKEKYLVAYEAYTKEIFELKRKHGLLVWRYNYIFRHQRKFIKKGFCDLNKNKYLKAYIYTRNQLIDMKNSTNEDLGIDKTLNEHRDNNINYYCKKLNLTQGIKYGYNK